MKKLIAIILSGTALLSLACNYDKEEALYPNGLTCANLNARFSIDVKPIIENNCAFEGCHGAGSTNGPGQLLTFKEIKAAAPEIKAALVTRLMPKGFSITTMEIKKISCWVDSGAPEN